MIEGARVVLVQKWNLFINWMKNGPKPQQFISFFLFQAAEGPGLAFIMYSEAIKNMPLSQLWSVLYFIMLLLLGMGSMLGNVTAIITPVRDFKVFSRLSNELFNGKINKWMLCWKHHLFICEMNGLMDLYFGLLVFMVFNQFIIICS